MFVHPNTSVNFVATSIQDGGTGLWFQRETVMVVVVVVVVVVVAAATAVAVAVGSTGYSSRKEEDMVVMDRVSPPPTKI